MQLSKKQLLKQKKSRDLILKELLKNKPEDMDIDIFLILELNKELQNKTEISLQCAKKLFQN